MKVFLLITAGWIVLHGSAFCQCPAAGIKIQSAACEDPRNLQVGSITCSEMKVKWLGNKSQTYLVKATGAGQATNNSYAATASQTACDIKGNCGATIPVKEGDAVSWSVQAVCTVQGAAVYSAEVYGGSTNVPVCMKLSGSSANTMRVYPNPANDWLIIQYDGSFAGNTEFKIYDLTGKKLYRKLDGNTAKVQSQYRIDIRSLPAGIYLLEAANGRAVNQAKFVVLRN